MPAPLVINQLPDQGPRDTTRYTGVGQVCKWGRALSARLHLSLIVSAGSGQLQFWFSVRKVKTPMKYVQEKSFQVLVTTPRVDAGMHLTDRLVALKQVFLSQKTLAPFPEACPPLSTE